MTNLTNKGLRSAHAGPLPAKGKFALIFTLVAAALAVLAAGLAGQVSSTDPWSQSELMEPQALAERLSSSPEAPNIICVAFPMLYRQNHILHARYAGPGNKPEGLEALKEAVSNIPKGTEVIIYCGCCPMIKCPNVRPAYRVLKDAGFTHIKVLNIPTNLKTDWTSKGYPVE
jgi:hypothetical protein